MNAYTTRGRARIRQSDLTNLMRAEPSLMGASLRALEWRRGCEAEAEMAWLLKQHGVESPSSASTVSALRQAIGAALIRAGERLAGVPGEDQAPEMAHPAPARG